MRVVLILILVFGSVQSCVAAWALATTSGDDCPTVVDTNPGRGLDYECSSDGGESKGSAVLLLAAIGLGFGGGALHGFVALARDRARARSGDTDTSAGSVVGAPVDLDEPHEHGPLSDERERDHREPMFVAAVVAVLLVLSVIAIRMV